MVNIRTKVRTYIRTGQTLYPFVVRGDNNTVGLLGYAVISKTSK